MCDCCGNKKQEKLIQYECTCAADCDCPIIEFDEEPEAVPYCCGVPMERVEK
ncbi:hypothetical protein HY792_03670 [Candidatus Desantisbacteria bacterium]|nr:hypothetical protein [Candidatus Desantisbacteria bacterium]